MSRKKAREDGPGRRLRILVCAFGPFPGVPVNPSQRAALDLLRMRRPALAGIEIEVVILPTRWDALARLDAMLGRRAPDGVLLFGVAARRQSVCIETLAVNAVRAFPDAARRHPPARRLSRRGPDRRATTASIQPLVRAMRGPGIATQASREAGRYLCNGSYFHALAWADTFVGKPPVVFVHLPGRTGRPRGVARQTMAQALSALLVAFTAQVRRVRGVRRRGRPQAS